MRIRPKTLYLMIGLSILAGLAVLLPACAHLKDVLRTVDEIATEACELFAHDHPAEFATLVQRTSPRSLPQDAGVGFKLDPRVLCAIKSVVQPFLDSQLRLQQDTVRSLQASPTDDSGGWRPAGADSSLP